MTKTNAAAAMGLTLAALLGPCFGAAAQSAQPLPADVVKQDIRDIEEMYQRRVEQTPFPGLYRLDMGPARGARRTSPVLLTRGAEYGFNNGVRGPRREEDHAALSLADWEKLVMRWRDSIRLGDLVQFGEGPLRLIVLSSFDCPYSKALEAKLAKAGVRYAVAPSTIGTANARYLPDLWCSADRASSWRAAINEGRLPPRADRDCRYDADYFETLSGLLGGSAPTLLYADGTIANVSTLAPVEAKLAELAQRDIKF